MGISSEPPYLYDSPTAHRAIAHPYSTHRPTQSQSTFLSASEIDPTTTTFNPKAVTQASYARLSQQSAPPKPKKEGPLIDFNKHPDSYVVFGGGVRPDYKALPPGTKKAVVVTRWVQFALRLLQEVCALGLLAGTICIKGTKGAETYLLRIPQAWDSLITLYAIYHLLRPAKGRTPGSSASYHTFALIMDTALIPLYIYVVLLLNTNRHLDLPVFGAAGNMLDGDWRFTSFFPTDKTYILLFVCMIGAAALAGLHFLSCGLDIYLVLVFRRIAVLPPDMNPLEDNLTGGDRSKRSKHKYKNSELTVLDEKDSKHMSASTLSVNTATNRGSVYSAEGAREIPFGHSRNANGGSKTSLAFSPHNPESARLSRAEQEAYAAAASSPRTSRYEIRPDGKLEVRTRTRGGSRSPRSSVYVDAAKNISHGDLSQMRSEKDLPSIPVEEIGRALSPDLPNAAVQMDDVKREQGKKLLTDNWYVLDAEDDDDVSRQGTPGPPPTSRFAVNRGGSPRYAPLQHSVTDCLSHGRNQEHQDPTLYGYAPEMMPKPLGMHPPTPPTDFAEAEAEAYRRAEYGEGVDRAPTTASQITTSSVYSESSPSLTSTITGTPKGKYYGDLAAATRGVRGSTPQLGSPVRGGQGYGGYGVGYESPQPSRTPSPEKQARVISRTGADIADESVLYLHPKENRSGYSMRSRREVSGKVVEEGRGGERGSWGRRG